MMENNLITNVRNIIIVSMMKFMLSVNMELMMYIMQLCNLTNIKILVILFCRGDLYGRDVLLLGHDGFNILYIK